MEFQEFWKERKRLCGHYKECDLCPMHSILASTSCEVGCVKNPKEAEQIVKKWANEHPIVTNADKFKEVFGVPIGSYGAPCPPALTIYEIGTMSNNDWLHAEYQPPKGEKEQ